MELTLNGVQYVHVGNITYHAPPALSTILPSSGPAAGGTLIEARGVNLKNGDNYTCRFGHVVVSAVQNDARTLVCASPARAGTAAAVSDSSFSVSLNNHDYTTDPVYFRYQEKAVVSGIIPDAGPAAGGSSIVVHGANLIGGDGYRCRFGDADVVAELQGATSTGYFLTCTAPIPSASSYQDDEIHLPFEISINDQQFTTDGFLFRFFAPQIVDGITPTSGPTFGGTSVAIAINAGEPSSSTVYYCRFGPLLSFGAFISTKQVSCPSPAVDVAYPLVVSVSVSTNGQQFTDHIDFVYSPHPTIVVISPSSGPLLGGTLINVTGTNLQNGSSLICSFGTDSPVWVAASYHPGPPSSITCISPASSPTSVLASEDFSFRVSLNAQQFTASPQLFEFYTTPEVGAISPRTGPIEGGTVVVASGLAFAGGSHYQCHFFGPLFPPQTVPASFRSATAVACVTPSVTGGAADLVFQISLNGQQYSSSTPQLMFGFRGDSSVLGLSPASGPNFGATVVSVSGLLLGNGSDYRCRFGGLYTVNATYQDELIHCISPAQVHLSETGVLAPHAPVYLCTVPTCAAP